MHCSAGARQWKKDFRIHAGSLPLLDLIFFCPKCSFLHSSFLICFLHVRFLILVLQKLILERNWQLVQGQSSTQVIPIDCCITHSEFLIWIHAHARPTWSKSFSLLFFPLLVAWWKQHGISCLELQRIAMRILSQTCSSFGCEHDWSLFDQLHSPRNHRLAQKRWNDLMYVHYNLRFREHQLKKRLNSSFSHDVLQQQFLDDWIAEEDRKSFLEEEVTEAVIILF